MDWKINFDKFFELIKSEEWVFLPLIIVNLFGMGFVYLLSEYNFSFKELMALPLQGFLVYCVIISSVFFVFNLFILFLSNKEIINIFFKKEEIKQQEVKKLLIASPFLFILFFGVVVVFQMFFSLMPVSFLQPLIDLILFPFRRGLFFVYGLITAIFVFKRNYKGYVYKWFTAFVVFWVALTISAGVQALFIVSGINIRIFLFLFLFLLIAPLVFLYFKWGWFKVKLNNIKNWIKGKA